MKKLRTIFKPWIESKELRKENLELRKILEWTNKERKAVDELLADIQGIAVQNNYGNNSYKYRKIKETIDEYYDKLSTISEKQKNI